MRVYKGNTVISRAFRVIVCISTFAVISILLGTLWNNWESQEDGSQGVLDELRASEAVYARYVEVRKSIVKKYIYPGLINPWQGPIFLFDYFLPAFKCPYSIERIGVIGDGGKWMCGIERYGKNYREEDLLLGNSNSIRRRNGDDGTFLQPKSRDCIVYSFGVNRESSFEAEILDRTSCEIYAYDGSVDKMGPEIKENDEEAQRRIRFFQKYIGNKETNETSTLGGIMRRNGHSHINVLKIDIEGNEFHTLLQVLEEFPHRLPFDQLLLEIHVPVERNGEKVVGFNLSFSKFYKFWEKLENAGLRPFYKELNLHPCVVLKALPSVAEYSFINVKGLIL